VDAARNLQAAELWDAFIARLQADHPSDRKLVNFIGSIDSYRDEFLLAARSADDSTEQALALYAEQADAIRQLLDKHAPDTTGNLQSRIAQVFLRGAGRRAVAPIPSRW
jgi:hypothetical protein